MVYNQQIQILQTVLPILRLEIVLDGLQQYHGHCEEQVLVDTHVKIDILEMDLCVNQMELRSLMDDILVTGVLVLLLVR